MVQKMSYKDVPMMICGPDSPEYKSISKENPSVLPLIPVPKSPKFTLKIGGTEYEVSTHFNTDGKQTIYQQFESLLKRSNFNS